MLNNYKYNIFFKKKKIYKNLNIKYKFLFKNIFFFNKKKVKVFSFYFNKFYKNFIYLYKLNIENNIDFKKKPIYPNKKIKIIFYNVFKKNTILFYINKPEKNLFFLENFNLNKLFENQLNLKIFFQFNKIKFFLNQRLVKQPIVTLNFNLNSNFKSNNSNKIFSNYLMLVKKKKYNNFFNKINYNLYNFKKKKIFLDKNYLFLKFLFKTVFKVLT